MQRAGDNATIRIVACKLSLQRNYECGRSLEHITMGASVELCSHSPESCLHLSSLSASQLQYLDGSSQLLVNPQAHLLLPAGAPPQ